MITGLITLITISYFANGCSKYTKNVVGEFTHECSGDICRRILPTVNPTDYPFCTSIEVDVSNLPSPGKYLNFYLGKWPITIRHRTSKEIEESQAIDYTQMEHPQSDKERLVDPNKPEWVVVYSVCTLEGCGLSINNRGGWFCACHPANFDTSGRAVRGLNGGNLKQPKVSFNKNGTKMIIKSNFGGGLEDEFFSKCKF
jgi:ubiquinol-cytochrome c reductase iron-sulfur subunit